MISEGEEYIETTDALIPSIEVALGHGEGVSEMEQSVHIGVGEGLEELGLLVGFSREIVMPVPDVACSWLKGDEFVSAGGVLHVNLN